MSGLDEYDVRALARLKSRIVVRADTGCWEWQGARLAKGYGKFYYRGKLRNVHRVAYELLVAPIPAGMQIDHFVCDNARCCNPEHMRPVTARENLLRSEGRAATNAAKTHCKYGHEFTPDNTYIRENGGRTCRACGPRRRREKRAAR
jgi:hypothetical protein